MRTRRTPLAVVVISIAAFAGLAACSSSGGNSNAALPPQAVGEYQLTGLQPGQVLCTEFPAVYKTPGGQEFATDENDVEGTLQAPSLHCDNTAISRNTQGSLVYKVGVRGKPDVIPTQPLTLDTSANPSADLFLTQNLRHELTSGEIRYVDSAAVETDPGGFHLLAGFPTAAKRFHDYYASVQVVDGSVQVCLPVTNDLGLHGGGNDHKDTYVRVTAHHDGETCQLPAVAKLTHNPVSVSGIPVLGEGFGECSDLLRGPGGQYFVPNLNAFSFFRDAGLPGYTRWPLHTKITRRSATVFSVYVLDPGSCNEFEPRIVPIRQAA